MSDTLTPDQLIDKWAAHHEASKPVHPLATFTPEECAKIAAGLTEEYDNSPGPALTFTATMQGDTLLIEAVPAA